MLCQYYGRIEVSSIRGPHNQLMLTYGFWTKLKASLCQRIILAEHGLVRCASATRHGSQINIMGFQWEAARVLHSILRRDKQNLFGPGPASRRNQCPPLPCPMISRVSPSHRDTQPLFDAG